MTQVPLFTREFILVSLANFANGISFALFVHFSGHLAELGASRDTIGIIFGVSAVSAIAIRPFLGRMLDGVGRRPVILVGNVTYLIFVLLHVTVTSTGPWVYAVRVGYGLSEAVLFSSLLTYGADVVPDERRTEGMALFGATGLLPIGIGGLLGDAVLAEGSYQHLFLTAGFFAFVTLLLSTSLPERRPQSVADIEPAGFLAVVRNDQLTPLWWIFIWFSFALSGYLIFMRNFVDDTGIGSVGLFFGVYTTIAIIVRVFFSRLPDRCGRHRILYPMMAVLVIGFVVLATARSWHGVAAAGFLCGIGHGFAFPIFAAMVVDRAPVRDRGSAMSMFTALFDGGLFIGGPVLGTIIERASYTAMYAACAGVLLVATLVYAAWEIRRARQAERAAPGGIS